MITVKTPDEIKILKEGGKILASVLRAAAEAAKPGVSASELDALAEKLIRRAGGEPSFKNYRAGGRSAYPASLCVSLNNEIVHGIPFKDKILKEGDIAGLDLGMKYKGLYTDMAITVPVGKANENVLKIIEAAKKSLDKGIREIKEGARVGDIGSAIQRFAESRGFSVVRELVGHGVGYAVHEEPEIPNFGKRGTGPELKEGMVLALEPMINAGSPEIVLASDGWTWKTKDGSVSAHFERTVAVAKNGADVLTKME